MVLVRLERDTEKHTHTHLFECVHFFMVEVTKSMWTKGLYVVTSGLTEQRVGGGGGDGKGGTAIWFMASSFLQREKERERVGLLSICCEREVSITYCQLL